MISPPRFARFAVFAYGWRNVGYLVTGDLILLERLAVLITQVQQVERELADALFRPSLLLRFRPPRAYKPLVTRFRLVQVPSSAGITKPSCRPSHSSIAGDPCMQL